MVKRPIQRVNITTQNSTSLELERRFFHAGYASSDKWSALNSGLYSVAFGKDNTAKGDYSFSFETDNKVNGSYAIGMGQDHIVDAPDSAVLSGSNGQIVNGQEGLSVIAGGQAMSIPIKL